MDHKRIFLFTNDDDPLNGDGDETKKVHMIAQVLREYRARTHARTHARLRMLMVAMMMTILVNAAEDTDSDANDADYAADDAKLITIAVIHKMIAGRGQRVDRDAVVPPQEEGRRALQPRQLLPSHPHGGRRRLQRAGKTRFAVGYKLELEEGSGLELRVKTTLRFLVNALFLAGGSCSGLVCTK